MEKRKIFVNRAKIDGRSDKEKKNGLRHSRCSVAQFEFSMEIYRQKLRRENFGLSPPLSEASLQE